MIVTKELKIGAVSIVENEAKSFGKRAGLPVGTGDSGRAPHPSGVAGLPAYTAGPAGCHGEATGRQGSSRQGRIQAVRSECVQGAWWSVRTDPRGLPPVGAGREYRQLFRPEKSRNMQTPSRRWFFVTATDGNHGRGVSWAAGQLGCEAHVYMPVGSSELRAQAIRDVNPKAESKIMETGYDDTVRYAAKQAEEHGWYLVQDTSWDGYEEIPAWIIQGYTTMAYEACQQMTEQGLAPPMFRQAASVQWQAVWSAI